MKNILKKKVEFIGHLMENYQIAEYDLNSKKSAAIIN